jgi:hypothetical protein
LQERESGDVVEVDAGWRGGGSAQLRGYCIQTVSFLILGRARCGLRRIVSAGLLQLVRAYSLLVTLMFLTPFARWYTPVAGMDIYAFTICCAEILDTGTMPWQLHDDGAVV